MDFLLVVLLVVSNELTVVNAEDFRFLGVGYNLVKGNPDASNGGTDPGIEATRFILRTDTTNSIATERDSCETHKYIYENSKSYQEKVQEEIIMEGDASFGGYSFSASAGLQSAQEQTMDSYSLIYEYNSLCITGEERYYVGLVESGQFKITDSFASAVCDLGPSLSTDENGYMNFLDDWGTHIITELELGYRTIERKSTTTESLLEYAESTNSAAISFSGSSGLASASLSVDVSQFKSDENFMSTFESNVASYTIGSKSLPEPIKLTLASITDILDTKYWSNFNKLVSRGICQSGFNVTTVKAQMEIALTEYAEWLNVEKVEDESIVIPLNWPKGTFGLNMPRLSCVQSATGNSNEQSACPSGTWQPGSWHQDTEDSNNENNVEPSYQCVTDSWSKSGITLEYCMMHEDTGDYRLSWPKGTYCIYKLGDCPSGFTSGKISQDNEDKSNDNIGSGYSPDGQYDSNTAHEFCCREDGYTTAGIYLPTDKPFYLFAKNEHCQTVNGMTSREDTVYWDDEDSDNNNWRTGSVPYQKSGLGSNTMMTFCYYTLTASTSSWKEIFDWFGK